MLFFIVSFYVLHTQWNPGLTVIFTPIFLSGNGKWKKINKIKSYINNFGWNKQKENKFKKIDDHIRLDQSKQY